MNWSDVKEVQAFIKKHDGVIGELTDLLQAREIGLDEGEALLMLLAGVSAGLRQTSITKEFSAPIAVGWTLAVTLGGDPS